MSLDGSLSPFDIQEKLRRRDCEFRNLYNQFDQRIIYCGGRDNDVRAAFCKYRGKESMNLLGKFYKRCDYA